MDSLKRLAAVLVAFVFFFLCMWLSMQIKPAHAPAEQIAVGTLS